MLTWRELYQETCRGKSIGRILTNHVLRGWRKGVSGVVLDLACGHFPSYWRAMGLVDNPTVRLVGVDRDSSFRPNVVADLTGLLPFGDSVADVVIVSSFLYIATDPECVLREVRRILKPNGTLLLTLPLVFAYNPEPADYWRFTEDAARLLMRRTGFVDESIVPIGGRWTAASYLLSPFLRPGWLVAPIVYGLCLRLDAWTKRHTRLADCPIGYVARARVES